MSQESNATQNYELDSSRPVIQTRCVLSNRLVNDVRGYKHVMLDTSIDNLLYSSINVITCDPPELHLVPGDDMVIPGQRDLDVANSIRLSIRRLKARQRKRSFAQLWF